MNTLAAMWSRLWKRTSTVNHWEEEQEGSWGRWSHAVLRLAIIFGLLFSFVLFAFWWAGSAVNFTAARAADRSVPTWEVSGMVIDAVTRQPIPWALVEDDPAGQPPFFRTDADLRGVFSISTLAEPHRLRASAPGYSPKLIEIGRAWFIWMPRGKESRNIELHPLHSDAYRLRDIPLCGMAAIMSTICYPKLVA